MKDNPAHWKPGFQQSNGCDKFKNCEANHSGVLQLWWKHDPAANRRSVEKFHSPLRLKLKRSRLPGNPHSLTRFDRKPGYHNLRELWSRFPASLTVKIVCL